MANNTEVELTDAQNRSALNEDLTNNFTDMVDIRPLRINLTRMMLRDLHQNSEEFESDDIDDFGVLLLFLEDLE